jgi:phage terminase small subunit
VTPSTGRPPAPSHLAPLTRQWWDKVVADFDFDEHHLRVLEAACVAWDRHEAARSALATHGLTFEDRYGNPRARPEVAIERDARIGFIRAVRPAGARRRRDRTGRARRRSRAATGGSR